MFLWRVVWASWRRQYHSQNIITLHINSIASANMVITSIVSLTAGCVVITAIGNPKHNELHQRQGKEERGLREYCQFVTSRDSHQLALIMLKRRKELIPGHCHEERHVGQ